MLKQAEQKYRIQVLLSSYNGEKYIKQQLDSILCQKGVQVTLLIRDDGSSDRTKRILNSYEKKYSSLSVYTGNRCGISGSFLDLLLHADLSNSYFAFADQDDVWKPDKLICAVRRLEKESQGQPLLYAGGVICASRDLKSRKLFSYQAGKGPSFGNALVENICMGCTEVFNRELLLLVREHLPPAGASVMHDWWMYLSASCFGKAVYDTRAYILYRQHEDNQIGMQDNRLLRWRSRICRAGQMKYKLSVQAAEFYSAYAGMAEEEEERLLELLCTYRRHFGRRLALAANRNIYRQDCLDDIVCRLLFMAGFL